ncbi:TRBM protein, partial [Urocynchramus pylzowi]|nr:TRBM protein [Urocynchramus pylzowi]
LLPLLLGTVALAQPRDVSPAGAQCLEHECFAVFWASRPFSGASEGCERGGGHLMTVRSTVAEEAIALLLQNREGRLWLGLSLSPSLPCTEPSRLLRGFLWVTGDRSTDYTNWAPSGQRCGERCVTVSRELRWEERRCEEAADGFLCQYSYGGSCPRLATQPGVLVTYATPFGASGADFLALPPRSLAFVPELGLELRCEDGDGAGPRCGFECRCHSGYRMVDGHCQRLSPCWEAPCQQRCEELPDGYRCGCQPGYAPDPLDATRCRLHCGASQCPALCDAAGACDCPEGFVLEDHELCVDVDECASDHCEFNCTNTPGGFQCHCPQGYRLRGLDCVLHGDGEEAASGDSEPEPFTPLPSRPPPKAEQLHPGVLVGIAGGALVSLLALLALGFHLARKRCRSHGSMDYKYSGPQEKELGLQPVPPAQK